MTLSPFEAEFLHKWNVYAPAYPFVFDPELCKIPYNLVPKYHSRSKDCSADFLHVFSRVCIEIQGGTRNGGKHGNGSGISRDAKKLYYAQLAGWFVIQIPTGEIDEYLPLVLEAIILRGGLPVVQEKPKSVAPVLAGNPF